jgi:dipeptidyl aminopeptidase/acylaminoacyl peptidase
LGGRPREIGRCRTLSLPDLSWDRTNTGLLFDDAPNNHASTTIYRLDLNGGPTRRLTRPSANSAAGEQNSRISPDGKTLAVMRQIPPARIQIVLHDLASGAERVLLSTTDNDDPLAWSNDSTALFVGRNIPWDSSLWAYPVNGSAPQRITETTSGIGWVSSGPNGLIAIDLERSESDVAIASASPGLPAKSLGADVPNTFFPAYSVAYSRDGTLAATSPGSGVTTLLLSGTDGVLHQLLQLKSYVAGALAWSPDGARLVFLEPDNVDFAINVVNRQGEILRRFPYRAQEMGGVDWSEDGRSLLVTSEDSKGWRTWRVDLVHPQDRRPVMPYGWMFVKTRGSMIFGAKDDARGIWRLDGRAKRLTDWPDAGNSHSWEISNNRLIYADFTNPDEPVVMALPINGGPAKPIAYPTGLLPGARFAFNPRTGLVAYLRMTRQDTDIGWLRVARK